jgi:MYXO-CTERM domain-containing protein
MRTRTWLWIAAAGALLWQSGSAAAQECAADEDCVKGYTCEVVGESGCGFACPDNGEECVPPPDFECEVMQYKACVPGPCSSDADCEDGMVCHEYESFDCPAVDSGGAAECPPGSECPQPEPAPAPEPCEPSTTTQCVPRYAVPCEVDADCGDGFGCVEDIAYSCDGSGPVPSDDPDSGGGSDPGAGDDPAPAPEPRPAPEEPSCSEEPLGTFHCEAREVACEADADCPSEWSCEESYSRPVCGGASTDPAEAPPTATCPAEMTAIARVCADGSTGKPVCVDGAWEHVCPEDEEAGGEEPAPDEAPAPDDCGIDDTAPERVCAPPFHDLGWGWGGFAADGAAESGVAGGTPLSDPGAPGASPEPRADDDNAAAGGDEDQSISMGSGETGMDPEADSGGGCAVSAAGTSHGASTGVLALIGASLLGLRRRRRS